jgi:hypothetical protein
MSKIRLQKTVTIHAPRENVWQVLVDDFYTRQWYAAFSPGTHAITDWKTGSKALFLDDSRSGLAGIVMVNEPYHELSLEYKGIITDGAEDYESDEAVQMAGFFESYQLSEQNGAIKLDIACDVTNKYLEVISEAWDQALDIIKSMAETKTTNNMDTRQLLLDLDQNEIDFCAILSAFEPDQFNIAPFEGSWTAGQVTEHIMLAEQGIPETLLGSTSGTERAVDELVPVIESIFLDFKAKYKSPEFIIPSSGPHDQQAMLKTFREQRADIRKIAANEDLSVTCTDFAFPQVGELTRWEWLQFVLCHSKRHARQLRNIFEKVSVEMEK